MNFCIQFIFHLVVVVVAELVLHYGLLLMEYNHVVI